MSKGHPTTLVEKCSTFALDLILHLKLCFLVDSVDEDGTNPELPVQAVVQTVKLEVVP